MSTERASSPRPVVLRSRLTPQTIAIEIRRQERGSDFTGYTENYSFPELVSFIEQVGGHHWQLSRIPIQRLRCWNSRTPLRRLLHAIAEDEYGRHHLLTVNRIAKAIRRGTQLPGIVVARRAGRPNEHWILSGYRRLAAHRVAEAEAVSVFHPAGLFRQRATRALRKPQPQAASRIARTSMTGIAIPRISKHAQA